LKWLELSVEAPPEYVEPLSHIFYRYGEGGVAIESPAGFNPDEGENTPQLQTVKIVTFVPLDESARSRKSNIEIAVRLVAHFATISEIKEREVEEEDWESNWKEYFHPIRVGSNLVICPTWRAHQSLDDDVLIKLDPGMAFGTGHHPTTRMCMELLETLIVGGEKVIDVGCGSGILSISAAKLGAGDILGIEIESRSVEVALENCELNGISSQVTILNGSFPEIRVENAAFDVALANIAAKVVINLSEYIVGAVANGGRLVLSGILESSLKDVEKEYSLHGVHFDKVLVDGDWTAVLATKNVATDR
jgi:ribosomal protein L11 methyltransferase